MFDFGEGHVEKDARSRCGGSYHPKISPFDRLKKLSSKKKHCLVFVIVTGTVPLPISPFGDTTCKHVSNVGVRWGKHKLQTSKLVLKVF